MFFKIRYRMGENMSEAVDVTENVELNENEETLKPPAKKKRFEASSKNSVNDWELPEDLAEYANNAVNRFIKEPDLKESILYEFPVSTNLLKTKKMDASFKELLEEQFKKAVLNQEDVLFNIQKKVQNIFGPLSSLWQYMESEKQQIKDTNEASQDDLNQLEGISTQFEQTFTLVDQAINSIQYQRRMNVLSTIFSDKKKAKEILSDKVDIINEDYEYIFGSKFEDSVVKTQRIKRKTKEMLHPNLGKK